MNINAKNEINNIDRKLQETDIIIENGAKFFTRKEADIIFSKILEKYR